MTFYVFLLLGVAIGVGAGLAFVVFVRQDRGDDSPLGRAALIGAIIGGGLGAIAYNATTLGYEQGEKVIEIKSEEQFDKVVLHADKPVLVDFYWKGCPPCRDMAPVIAEIAEEGATPRGERYVVVSVEVVDNGAWVGKYHGGGVPHFVVYKNGQAVAQTRGGQPKENIAQLLEPHLD